MIDPKLLDMIGDTLKMLCDKVHEETGEHILIGYGLTDEKVTIEGCTTSKGLEYPESCKLLCGITAYAMDWYGNQEDES